MGSIFEIKDQLAVVLREYDALRKQVDQGTAFMQGLVIPLSVGVAGTMVGWQGKIPIELAILALPVLVMASLAAAQHGEAYTEYAGQLLAGVENRVFQICGHPLLCHETKLAVKRKNAGAKGWWLTVLAVSAVYVLCESWLWRYMGWRAFRGAHDGVKPIASLAAAAPVVYGFVMAARFQWARRRWPLTPLAVHLIEQVDL